METLNSAELKSLPARIIREEQLPRHKPQEASMLMVLQIVSY